MLKDGVFSLGLPSYRSSLYHVAAKKACGTSALTSDYGHGLGSATIRLLLFESKWRRLSTAYLQRITVWVRYRSRSFGTKLLRIGVRGNRDRLYAHNSLSHLVTHFHTP